MKKYNVNLKDNNTNRYLMVPYLRKTMGENISGRIYFRMAIMMSITPIGMIELNALLDETNYVDNKQWDEYNDWDERAKNIFRCYTTNPDIFYGIMREAAKEESNLTTLITSN